MRGFTVVPKVVFNGKDRMSKQPTHYLGACHSRQMANVGGYLLLGESLCIVYTLLGPMTVLYSEFSHGTMWDETLVKCTLLINLGRVSCTNYFMPIRTL